MGQRFDKKIAGVGVYMNEIGDKDLMHVNVVETFSHLAAVYSASLGGVGVSDADIGHIFKSQDPGGAE